MFIRKSKKTGKGSGKKRPGNITKYTLQRVVEEVLNLPYTPRQGKTHDIVATIFNSIKAAVLRGERVKLPGFGTFFLRTRPAYKTPRCYSYYTGAFTKDSPWDVQTVPANTMMVFKPSRLLLDFINEN